MLQSTSQTKVKKWFNVTVYYCFYYCQDIPECLLCSRPCFLSSCGGQSCRHAWCLSGSAGRPAACPVGWGWGRESDMSNSIPRTAHCASSTRRRLRSVSSTISAVSLSWFCMQLSWTVFIISIYLVCVSSLLYIIRSFPLVVIRNYWKTSITAD